MILSALALAVALFVIDMNTTNMLSDNLKQIQSLKKDIQDLKFRVNLIQGVAPSPMRISYVTIPKGINSACATNYSCFNPSIISVPPETTITWYNADGISHTITSGKASDGNAGSLFDSGLIKSGSSFSYTPRQEGTIDYFCTVHPWETGKIVVEKP